MLRAYASQQEESPQWEDHASQIESSPHSLQLEKAFTQKTQKKKQVTLQ